MRDEPLIRTPPDDPLSHWTPMGTAQAVPANWLIENVLPVGMTIIGGPPKSTKSTLTYAMAAMLAGVECNVLPLWMRKVTRTGTVLMVSPEATAGEIKDTLIKGTNTKVPEDVPIYVGMDPWEYQLDGTPNGNGVTPGQERLLEWLEYFKPVCTILDPFRDFITVSENDAGEVIQALRPIRDWHHKNDAAFVLVHHTSKRAYQDRKEKMTPQDLRGSSAIFGKADGVIMMTPIGDPNPVELYAWFKRGAVWNRTIMPATYGVTDATEVLEPNDERIFKYVESGVPDAKALGKAAHLDLASVEESLARLRRNGWIGKRDGHPVVLKPWPKKGGSKNE